ncbi:hypothetical protein MMC21_000601 [Puttea exsequens]|nr:hypothetical protein [Puttea exsequens]
MDSSAPASTFPLLTTIPTSENDLAALPPFTVSIPNGFLPLTPPPTELPDSFTTLTSLLERMPIHTAAGTLGLLATFTLGEAVLAELPDLTDEIDKPVRIYSSPVMRGIRVVRGMDWVGSVCRVVWRGRWRESLRCESIHDIRTLFNQAEESRSGFKPFMEYAGSYALFNWRMRDPKLGLEYDNLRLIRAFEYGLESTSSEAGFVLVHVDMVRHSGKLVDGAANALSACGKSDRKLFNDGLEAVVQAMIEVNGVMDGMWKKSKPNDYNSFRTFIFGITKQSMFPHGVVYEGVSDDPMSFRGESGANDSMIPLCDNVLEISNHRQFLEWVKDRAQYIGIKYYALQNRESTVLYLHALNQVRDFRWRHWCFTREYILKKSSHPTATGGSPIVLWLPNQLFSVYHQMIEVDNLYGGLAECRDIMELVSLQAETLQKEVDKFCADRD